VISMGVCASSGGMFNNYAIVQGVDHVVPVDMYLPGCPPRPEMLIDAILKLHDQVQHAKLGANRVAQVEELETAGVCGLSIEDTMLPPVFGSAEKPQVLSIEEGVGKMRAALAGRQDKRLVIVGRTSSIGITGLADTIARAKAYEAAGVDAFFMAGAKTRRDVEAVAAAIKIPLVLGTPSAELQDLDYLSARRVRICIQGHLPVAAAVRAAYETLKALREGVKPKDVAGVASPELMKQATREADYRRWMKEFLGA